MNDEIEFLNYILQNSEMGFTSIKDLINSASNKGFKAILKNQYKEYKNIYDEAIEMFNEYEEEEKNISKLAKISSYIMIKINLLNDKSTSNIAEMMIKGSNMGIIDITKKINSYKDVDPRIIKLANKLLTLEETNIEELQPYLKENNS